MSELKALFLFVAFGVPLPLAAFVANLLGL